jgi:hypothetical protein
VNKEFYENKALEWQHAMKSKFCGDVKTNFMLVEYLGRFGRDYVLDKYEHAVPLYHTNNGREYVGIYDTQGIRLTAKQNYAKEQHRQQLLGPLVECQNASHISCWVVWRDTARLIIAANLHESPELLSSLYAFMAMENIAKGAGPQALEWTTLTTDMRR